VAFSREAYPCIWSRVLQWDLASGYGYDLAWAQLCGEGRAAVIHAVKVSQFDLKTVRGAGGTADGSEARPHAAPTCAGVGQRLLHEPGRG
jgi:hypothetical protein